jgi:hypothetical protein
VNANQKAKEATAPLTININFAALGIEQETSKLEQLRSDIIESEVVEQVPREDSDG